ncbi:MAG: hypothetical protein LBV09_05270 [Deferribacteraceae bacterium]|jgi:hypothetical protein|nr:hypothetical protein [Deferribacteraceae bacterium]
MLSSSCGADCNDCEFKAACSGGCFACEGKACYVAEMGLGVCAIYDCAVNKKGYASKTCAECADLPCEIFMSWKDPSMSDEAFKANVDMRVANLKATL